MRLRQCLGLLAVLVLPAIADAAPGIAMRWDRCYADAGAANKAFACDTNSGTHSLTVSFSPAADIDQVSGNEIVLDLLTASATLPDWWQFKNGGSCRISSLNTNVVLPPGSVNCDDPWRGQGAGGIGAYNLNYFNTQARPRILIAVAVPADALGSVLQGHEYFSFNLTIDHARTVGAGSCSGCVTPMCLLATSLTIVRPLDIGDVTLREPLGPNSNVAAWQGGSPALYYIPPDTTTGRLIPGYWSIGSCGLPTPARNQTWGAIKSLYR